MPVIPDAVSTFGTRPIPQSQRGVVSYNPTLEQDAEIKAGAQLAQTGQQIQKTGAELQDKKDNLDVAAAKSQYMRDMLDLQNQVDNDPNYIGREDKFRQQEAVIRQQSLGMIGDTEKQQMSAYDFSETADRLLVGVRNNAKEMENSVGRGFIDTTLDQNKEAALQSPDKSISSKLISTSLQSIDDAVTRGYLKPEEAVKKKKDFVSDYGTDWFNRQPDDLKLKLINDRMGIPTGPSTAGAMPPGASPSDAPLNVRNNNPGNMRAPDGQFQVYPTPAAGMDAMRSDLTVKINGDSKAMAAKFGANYIPTLANVISTWAPSTENDTKAYIAKVSKATGLQPGDTVTKDDLDKLIPAMVHVEGGDKAASFYSNPTSDPMGPVAPRGKTFTPVDFIDPDKVSALKNQVESDIRQKQVLYRADLVQKVSDANAMALNGVQNPTPITQDQFTAAYGDKGTEAWAEYQKGQVFASDVNRVQTMKPAEQISLLDTIKPMPGVGYDIAQKRYDVLQKAIATVNTDRQTDPVAYGQRAKMIPNEPLDFQNPQKLAFQIQRQATTVQSMAPEYGVPLLPLNKNQAEQMSSLMKTMPAENRLSYLKALSSNITDKDQYIALMSQVRPKSPTTALAGAYVGYDGPITDKTTTPPDIIATRLLKGEDLINPPTKEGEAPKSKFTLPESAGEGQSLQSLFDNKTSGVFRGKPDEALRAFDSVKAYYAALSAETGDFSGKWNPTDGPKRLDQAIKDVVGNIVAVNGKNNVAAPYGMDEATFLDEAHASFNDELDKAGLDKTKWGFNAIGLNNTDQPNTYAVLNGGGAMFDRQGKPIKITVTPGAHPAVQLKKLGNDYVEKYYRQNE